MADIKNIFFDFKKAAPSGATRLFLYVLGIVLVVLLIFHAGFVAGSRHRSYPGEGGLGFRVHAPGFGEMRLPRGFLPHGHGTVGTIQSISTSSITLQTRDGSSQTVLVSDKTLIRNSDGSASSSALTKGLPVIVLGTPDETGQISAELIRLLPPPPSL